MTINLSNIHLEALEDPGTERFLLPAYWHGSDKSRRIKHYRIALKNAMYNCVSQQQREQLELHYGQGLTKSAIAKRQNKGCSAITKSMRAGQEALRNYIELYMEIYDALEQEFLADAN